MSVKGIYHIVLTDKPCYYLGDSHQDTDTAHVREDKMLRTRKKKFSALGAALLAFMVLMIGISLLGNIAMAGFLIAAGLVGMVYCAYFMGQKGFHSEIEIDSQFYCYGDQPCGHSPERAKPGCAGHCDAGKCSDPAPVAETGGMARHTPPPTE